MKQISILLLFIFVIFSCKDQKTKETSTSTLTKNKVEIITTPQKIALANGLENWNNVNEIHYTFNVDKGDYHMDRSWIWKPKTNEISYKDKQDSLLYSRSIMDTNLQKIDAKFINDKYWLLAPFNLDWDKESYTYSEEKNSIAPISKDTLNQLTIVYKNEGGYTPGDAYDLYYTDDFVIKEWVYRESNNDKPSMITTWENHETFKGITIAKDFITLDGTLKISFSNIEVH